MVAFVVGAVLALGVGLLGTRGGLDRDRAFYPVVAIVVASYYVLFAVMGGSTRALVLESVVGVAFAVAAVLGFKSSLWIVAGALAGHGIFDLSHDIFISNPGVPRFWPPFCSTFDIVFAAYLVWLLRSGRLRAAA